MGLQSYKSPNFENFETPKLSAGPMAKHKEYYMGEGAGFPQVRAMVNLVNLCLPMVRLCTNSAPIMH